MEHRGVVSREKVRQGLVRRRRRQTQRVVLGAILLVVLTSLVTYSVFGQGAPGLASGGDPRISKLWTIVRLVQEQYVDGPLDVNKLLEGAYEGVVRALGDPHSNYLSKEAYEEWIIDIGGRYAGVGMTIIDRDGVVEVVRAFPGTPAHKAGLRPGDRIVKVDDRETAGLTADDVANMVRGQPGTRVRLTVERDTDGSPQVLQFDLVRANIQVPAVEGVGLLPGGIGYVQLTNFNENAYEQTAAALEALRKQGMRALILDLRQNGGGALDQAVKIAGLFVPGGVVVSVMGRDGRREEYRTEGAGLGQPLVVLVDGYTASASEIVAGAVRDYGTGRLVGTRTFGKGSVQHLFPLPDGSGVRVTVAKYYTPSGMSIHKVGLVPDVEVSLPQGELPLPPLEGNKVDAQVAKALEVARGLLGER